jgi:hypothetical protein
MSFDRWRRPSVNYRGYENLFLPSEQATCFPIFFPGKDVLVDTLNSPFSAANRSSGFDSWIPKEYALLAAAIG